MRTDCFGSALFLACSPSYRPCRSLLLCLGTAAATTCRYLFEGARTLSVVWVCGRGRSLLGAMSQCNISRGNPFMPGDFEYERHGNMIGPTPNC